MRRYLLIGPVVAAALVLFPAPSAEQEPDRPGGRVVLGLHPPERVAVVDVRTGRAIVRRLPGGTLCHGPLLVSGGRLIRSGSRRANGVISMDLSLKGLGVPLGEANQYLPSATPGRLWLATVSYRRGGTVLRGVREVTVGGRTTFVARHRAPGLHLMGALSDGLLFEGGGRLRVWDPRSGRVVRGFHGSFVVAIHGRNVAHCSGRCATLHVTGPRADRVIRLPAPDGYRGAFTPDGSLLATTVQGGRIALVDIARQSVRLIPAARTAAYSPLAWAPDGRWLFFSAPNGRLMAYRLDGGRLVAIPHRVRRGTVLEMAAAP